MTSSATALCSLSACELAARISSRAVDPRQVTAAHLQRIDSLNDTVNAYISVRSSEASAESERAHQQILAGNPTGTLIGLPLAVKDNVCTAGDMTTAGSKILIGSVTPEDATVIKRVKDAGAILLGKTSMMEFAVGDDLNPLNGHGPSRNPWDLSRSTSGSSGGSAAALAAGLCAMSIGTDTGGSVRLPAAYCGVVGLKPTFGRVSRRGVIPLAWSLDCVGPMTRTIADNATLLQVMAGHDPLDGASAARPRGDYLRNLTTGVGGLRVGIPKRYFMEYALPNVAEAVMAVARELECLGARLIEIDLTHARYSVAAWTTIMLAEMSAYHRTYVRRGSFPDYTQMTRVHLDWAESVTGADYVQAQRLRRFMATDFEQAFADVDVVLVPTAPIEANLIEEDLVSKELPTRAPPAGTVSTIEMTLRMTAPASLTGLPALAVPCGFSAGGLPLSAQFIGRWFDEETLYRSAFAYEKQTPWHRRCAPL